jgi:serine/threonine protein kinase, bacterial
MAVTRCAHRKALSAVVVVLLAAMGVTGCERTQTRSCAPSSLSPFPNGPRQSVLPITVHEVGDIAVNTAGNVYATDWGCYAGGSTGAFGDVQVVKLAPGSSTQAVVGFTGLNGLGSVAVDAAGNVYVTNATDNRVRKLAAGANSQSVLGFSGLDHPDGVAVDGARNVYVADTRNNRVLELPAGSSAQTVVQFSGLNEPRTVAVDGAGNVYANTFDVDFDSHYVLKLAAG